MKTKELETLKTKSLTEIDKILDKKRQELIKTRVSILESKEKNLRKTKLIRHEIAQIMTIRGIIASSKKEEKNK